MTTEEKKHGNAKEFAPCRHCGDRQSYSHSRERFCSAQVGGVFSDGALTGFRSCGVALSARHPMLVNTRTARIIPLEFSDFPDAGEITIGNRGEHAEGVRPGYINLACHDAKGLLWEQHAKIRLRNGRTYIAKCSSSALVKLNDVDITGEMELTPMCSIRLGPELLFYFLP